MLRYSILIQWSDENKTYLVTFPEWPNSTGEPHAHGDTYEEAARNGREMLEKLLDSDVKPEPWTYKPLKYANKEEAMKLFYDEIKPRHDDLFRELAAIEQKEREHEEKAKCQKEREKHENHIAWLNRENDRMKDERKGVGYSKFYAQWIDEHNGNGDGMEDAWKQTEAYKAKQEEKRQKNK